MTAGWIPVAKKDFRDAIRAKSIWVTTLGFVVFAAGATVLYAWLDVFHGGNPNAAGLIAFVRSATTMFVPIMAVLVGYRSIAGERESGSHRLLLSMPVSRRDVVLGKLLGRTGVVVVPALVAYLVAAALGVALIGTFDFLQFALFGALTAVYALAYVSVVLGISAAADTASKSLAGAVVFWAVFNFLWGTIGFVLLWATSPGPTPSFDPVPAWYVLFTRLPPSGAFAAASTALTPGSSEAALVQGMPSSGEFGFSMPDGPFFVENWFGFLPLAVWIVAPVWLGYRRFAVADL